MSTTAPKSNHGTTLPHWFSKGGWARHSETAFKVYGIFCTVNVSKFLMWPTGYCMHYSCNEDYLGSLSSISSPAHYATPGSYFLVKNTDHNDHKLHHKNNGTPPTLRAIMTNLSFCFLKLYYGHLDCLIYQGLIECSSHFTHKQLP